MKQTLLALCFLLFSGGIAMAQNPSVKYNSESQTFSVRASNVPLDKIISQLCAEGLIVFAATADEGMPVNASFSNLPIEEGLKRILPPKSKFSYRLEMKEFNSGKKRSVSTLETKKPGPMQSENKSNRRNSGKKFSGAQMSDALKLKASSVKFKGGSTDAYFKGKTPALKGGSSMASPKSIVAKDKPVNPKMAASRSLSPDVSNLNKGKHLVVTFKVTENGIEPISSEYAEGAYVPQNKYSGYGEMALVGSESGKVVYMAATHNPLEATSISDPDNGVFHKPVKFKEGYITVKMPNEYANKATSKGINLELASVKTKNGLADLFERKSQNKLMRSELGRGLKLNQKIKAVNLTKLKVAAPKFD